MGITNHFQGMDAGIAASTRELSYENGREDATAETSQAAKIANDAEPVTFDELFKEFDAWHFDRFRNHAERMQVELFFEFLQHKKVVKETV